MMFSMINAEQYRILSNFGHPNIHDNLQIQDKFAAKISQKYSKYWFEMATYKLNAIMSYSKLYFVSKNINADL